MKLDADEKELLDSVERGEWKSAKGGKRERARYSRYAKATFRKDRRLNIRLSSRDLAAAVQWVMAKMRLTFSSEKNSAGETTPEKMRANPSLASRLPATA